MLDHQRWHYRLSTFGVLIAALIGASLMRYITSQGIGISPDSTVYLSAAQSLSDGNGLFVPFLNGPMLHYPPLYPIILHLISIFKIDIIDGAMWLNVVLFGLNIVLTGVILLSITQNNFWIPILSALFIASSPSMLLIHAWAWTEPIFIFSGFLGLLLLSRYLKNSKLIELCFAAFACGFAFLSRYAGMAYIFTGFLGIIFFDNNRIRVRLKNLILYLSISIFPTLLWIVRNQFLYGNATNRHLVYHPLSIDNLNEFLQTISNWLIPSNETRILWGPILLLAFFLTISSAWFLKLQQTFKNEKTKEPNPGINLLALLIIFSLTYLSFLVASITFFDAYIPLDDRILTPLFYSLVILIALIVYLFLSSVRLERVKPYVYVSFIGITFILIGGQIKFKNEWIHYSHQEGIGFNSRGWKNSEIIKIINSLPPHILIYSNGPDVIFTLTRRSAYFLPNKVNPIDQTSYSTYWDNLENVGNLLLNDKGVIVTFTAISRDYLASDDDLLQNLSLDVVVKEHDGNIYMMSSDTEDVPAYTIKGTIKDDFGAPLHNVLVVTDSGNITITDLEGMYSISEHAGAHTITPTLAGFSFTPPTIRFSLPSDSQVKDFIGTISSDLTTGQNMVIDNFNDVSYSKELVMYDSFVTSENWLPCSWCKNNNGRIQIHHGIMAVSANNTNNPGDNFSIYSTKNVSLINHDTLVLRVRGDSGVSLTLEDVIDDVRSRPLDNFQISSEWEIIEIPISGKNLSQLVIGNKEITESSLKDRRLFIDWIALK